MDDRSRTKDEAHGEFVGPQQDGNINPERHPKEEEKKMSDDSAGVQEERRHNTEKNNLVEGHTDNDECAEKTNSSKGNKKSKLTKIAKIQNKDEASRGLQIHQAETDHSLKDNKTLKKSPNISGKRDNESKDSALIEPSQQHEDDTKIADNQNKDEDATRQQKHQAETDHSLKDSKTLRKSPNISGERDNEPNDSALIEPPQQYEENKKIADNQEKDGEAIGQQKHKADVNNLLKDSKTLKKSPNISGKRNIDPTDAALREHNRQHRRKDKNPRKIENPLRAKTKRAKSTKPHGQRLGKFTKQLKMFGATVRNLWNVWGNFKTQNQQEPSPTVSDMKTLGVPGFEEIACIEAEVPDIMMTDKDRVRTSCKECMKDPPAFPSKDQIKAKLIAADKYYGVKGSKSKDQSSTTLEHEADYYDVDGTIVRPSWRFILERPLVEQYVLMNNYIRKVSVLSEMKDEKTNFVEDKDPGDDTEYKKFEQKFIKERRELYKPILKPRTQEMAVQTSFVSEQTKEEIKESVSELSLYPESEESTNSPEVSAVTIVTSRDYSSPLQSDIDGRNTEKSLSYRDGNWWESQATCQPSESFQTSQDSVKKESSGSDGKSIPVLATWGETGLRPELSKGEWIVPSSHKSAEETPQKVRDSKRVRFSQVVTYYQGPDKNAAVYKLPKDEDIIDENEAVQNTQADVSVEKPGSVDEPESPKDKPRPQTLTNILQDRKKGQIVSMTLPKGWHQDRVLHDKQKVNVAVSRVVARNRPVAKKISFQKFDEIPDVQHSDPLVSTDANIQTQTPITQKSGLLEKGKAPIPNRHTKPVKLSYADTSIEHVKKSNYRVAPRILGIHEEVGNTRNGQESVGIGTNIQSIANPPVAPMQNAGTTSKAQSDGPRNLQTMPRSLQQQSTPGIRLGHQILESGWQSRIPHENIPYHPPIQHRPYSNCDLRESWTKPNTFSDPSLMVRPQKHDHENPQKRQHTSTDTEGSSTSNDHIKLKASPGCIFKVATPTDLSMISVDDFYPEVPEIDAELSQNSEHVMERAPKLEIVHQQAYVKCPQDTLYGHHKITRKEENTILQSSSSPIRSIGPSLEVSVRTGESTTQQEKSSCVLVKNPPVYVSQHCTLTQSRGSPPKSSLRESPEKTPRTDKAMRREVNLEEEVKQILKAKEVRKKETLPMKEANPSALKFTVPLTKQPQTTKQQQIMLENDGEKEDNTMRNAQKSQRQLASNREIKSEDVDIKQKQIEKEPEIGSVQEVSDDLEILQRQFEDTNIQGNLGQAKKFMSTLSSLEEETSSVMGSTSSSNPEKPIDMPVMARSVEELKTIFEKKPESNSVVSELGENQSHSSKGVGLLEESQDGRASGSSVENTGAVMEGATNQSKDNNVKGEQCSGLATEQNLTAKADTEGDPNVVPTRVNNTASGEKEVHSKSAEGTNQNPSVLLPVESSAHVLSQIDVIRPSEIYSNTSMYFSSEDRVAKLTKARTTFEPMMLDNEEAGSDCSGTKSRNVRDGTHTKTSKNLTAKPVETQPKEINLETEPSSNGGASNQSKMSQQLKKQGEANVQNTISDSLKTPHRASAAASKTKEDTSKPSETKQWLMDVIPTFSKYTRFHGFRPQKPICMKDGDEAEAVKNRQEAVKPVFRFLKRQRELEDNK